MKQKTSSSLSLPTPPPNLGTKMNISERSVPNSRITQIGVSKQQPTVIYIPLPIICIISILIVNYRNCQILCIPMQLNDEHKTLSPINLIFLFSKSHLKRQNKPSLIKYLVISSVSEIKVMHRLNLHLRKNHTYMSLNLKSPSTKKCQSPAQPEVNNLFDLF